MSQTSPVAALFILASCSVPPQSQDEPVVLPVIVVKEAPEKEKAKDSPKPATKPKPEIKETEKQKADTICPPKEGETEQQRVLRKLDCLIERD